MEQDTQEAQAAMVAGWRASWHEHPHEFDAASWDALTSNLPGGAPFLKHAFLCALIDSGCATPSTGWHPLLLALRNEAGTLLAACVCFAKTHSYGEYVFDWAWADAHDRAFTSQGQRYYPKLLCAVPFSPITGPRLLVHPELPAATQAAARQALLAAIRELTRAQGWSSAHLLFLSEADTQAVQAGEASTPSEAPHWLLRHGVQFHWQNRSPSPYLDFNDFLASLHRDKRKKIKQERRKVQECGVSFDVMEGAQISQADWDFFHRCHTQTYLERGRQPYLNRAFWHLVAQGNPDNWVLFVASLAGERIAAALLAVDRTTGTAYGRHWGALQTVSCLHFETCYYQPLQWCIEQRMQAFEGGAQGEHKLARGLLASPTRSAHWLDQPALHQAVANFLLQESQGMQGYMDELDERQPFKAMDLGAGGTQG